VKPASIPTRLVVTATLLFVTLFATPAFAHRLDEYLQATIISLEKNKLHAQLTLTPGVSVFPAVLAAIDLNGDGVVSEMEQRAYVGRVLGDLSLTIDGRPLSPQLRSMQFPAVEEMKDGRGEIQIEFEVGLPPGGPNRRIILKNEHQSAMAAYQVNCLVAGDPDIRIVGQNRNYSQSIYQLDYVQAGASSERISTVLWPGVSWIVALALLLAARFALLRKDRAADPLFRN
jgi:hypothetical protein